MAKQISKTAIGGFVISSIAILIAGVILLGGGEIFQKKWKFVMFFDESVKGLDVGAPVAWNGVQIGAVSEIILINDPEKMEFRIPIIMDMTPERIHYRGAVGKAKTEKELRQRIKQGIERGLRAQMTLQSLVTGKLMIELGFRPGTPVRLTGPEGGYPDHIEIPTLPSAMGALGKKLKDLPIDKIANELLGVLSGVKNVVDGPEIKNILGNVDAASQKLDQLMANANTLVVDADAEVKGLTGNLNAKLNTISKGIRATLSDARKTLRVASKNIEGVGGDAQKLLKNADAQIKPVSIKIQDAMDFARRAMDQGKKTLATVDNFVGERSDTRHKLNRTLDEIAMAAQSLKSLTDYLERHPEALLKGKGGR